MEWAVFCWIQCILSEREITLTSLQAEEAFNRSLQKDVWTVDCPDSYPFHQPKFRINTIYQFAINSPCPAPKPANIFISMAPSLLHFYSSTSCTWPANFIIFFSRKFQNETVSFLYNKNHFKEFPIHTYIWKLTVMRRKYNPRQVAYPEKAQEN